LRSSRTSMGSIKEIDSEDDSWWSSHTHTHTHKVIIILL
jgi:hypothetical protein